MLSHAKLPAHKPMQMSGDIVESMKQMANIVQKNGGVRQRRIHVNHNTDPPGKFDNNKTPSIDITTASWDMNQLGKTFITLDCTAHVRSDKVLLIQMD